MYQEIFGVSASGQPENDAAIWRRRDRLRAAAVGKLDRTGQSRKQKSDRGRAPAGKRTLNRLELTKESAFDSTGKKGQYRKMEGIPQAVERWCVGWSLHPHPSVPPEIPQELDATEDPIHGAPVKITVRKISLSPAEGCPCQDIFLRAHESLRH